MRQELVRIAAREPLEAGPFAGLEELRALGATPFDRFATKPQRAERRPATAVGRFDMCVEIGPPPRLA